jgi:hypothetical protein
MKYQSKDKNNQTAINFSIKFKVNHNNKIYRQNLDRKFIIKEKSQKILIYITQMILRHSLKFN